MHCETLRWEPEANKIHATITRRLNKSTPQQINLPQYIKPLRIQLQHDTN